MLLPDHFSTSKKYFTEFSWEVYVVNRQGGLALSSWVPYCWVNGPSRPFFQWIQLPPFLVPTDSPPSKLSNCGLWHFCLSLPMTFMVSLRFNIKQFHISFSGKRCTMLSKEWPGQYQILLYQANWPLCVDQYTLCVLQSTYRSLPPVDQRTNCVARGSVVPGPLLY